MFTLVRKTTIDGLGGIPTPYTKLSAWYIHVHNRPGLFLCVNVKPLGELYWLLGHPFGKQTLRERYILPLPLANEGGRG